LVLLREYVTMHGAQNVEKYVHIIYNNPTIQRYIEYIVQGTQLDP